MVINYLLSERYIFLKFYKLFCYSHYNYKMYTLIIFQESNNTTLNKLFTSSTNEFFIIYVMQNPFLQHKINEKLKNVVFLKCMHIALKYSQIL